MCFALTVKVVDSVVQPNAVHFEQTIGFQAAQPEKTPKLGVRQPPGTILFDSEGLQSSAREVATAGAQQSRKVFWDLQDDGYRHGLARL